LALSSQARAYIAEQLIESLVASSEAELSETWRTELRRRCQEIDEGAVELRDANDVFARAFSAIK
jgi:putative addiction module component (TIGR02574 family)